MRSVVRTITLLACFLMLASPLAGQGNCSLNTIQGTYVVAANGFFGVTPYTALGALSVTASGAAIANMTVATPLAPPPGIEQTLAATYAVSPDCRGTALYPDFKEELLVVNNGDEIRTLLVDPITTQYGPRIQTATVYRQSSGANAVSNCSAATMTGRYAQSCTGFVQVGPGIFLPTGFSATILTDGKGFFTGSGTFVNAGMKLPAVYKNGTYAVDRDCRGTASFQFEPVPGAPEFGIFTEKLVVFNQGKDLMSITTSGQAIDMCRFTRMDR